MRTDRASRIEELAGALLLASSCIWLMLHWNMPATGVTDSFEILGAIGAFTWLRAHYRRMMRIRLPATSTRARQGSRTAGQAGSSKEGGHLRDAA